MPASLPNRIPPAVHPSSRGAPARRSAPIARADRSQMPLASGSSKLMNSPDTLVQNALDGLIMQHPHLTKLDGFPDVSGWWCVGVCGRGGRERGVRWWWEEQAEHQTCPRTSHTALSLS